MAKKPKMFLIKNVANPDYCGIGAGSVQFAHGQATIEEGRMVEWFKEHKGYSVTEAKVAEATDKKEGKTEV